VKHLLIFKEEHFTASNCSYYLYTSNIHSLTTRGYFHYMTLRILIESFRP